MGTETSECLTASRRFRAEVDRFFWRNYLAHSIEGGLYIGGMAFLAGDTVMPPIVRSLGGSEIIISLMPTLMFIGFTMPPIFTSYRIERLRRVMPFVSIAGVFQRLPFLLAAMMLLFVGAKHPLLTLISVVLAPFISGIIGGGSFPGWLELVAKTIPAHRRSSLWAIRYIIAAVIGIGAGFAVKNILGAHPGMVGYGLLHLVCFGFLVLSYLVFVTIRETDMPPSVDFLPSSIGEHIRSLPKLIRQDPRFGRFLIIRFLGTGLFVMLPFLSIHVLDSTGLPESFIGDLVSMQWTGGILGNLLAAYLGDRFGGKLPFIIGNSLLVFVCVAAVMNTSAIAFAIVFFCFGFAFYMNRVGVSTLNVDICPEGRRATYLAIANAISCPGMIFSAFICWIIRIAFGTFWPTALVAGLMLCGSLILLLQMKEPRPARGRA